MQLHKIILILSAVAGAVAVSVDESEVDKNSAGETCKKL